MYAIIEMGGKQYWVEPGETIRVEKLEAAEGTKIELKALWSADEKKDGDQGTGSRNGKVTVAVVRQVKAPKIIVFRKKAKSHYKKTRGHRQGLTEIRIESVTQN
ncbi:MAG: 50S ribosomal protein L21 [Elusimicrobiota bacterium]